MQARLLPDIDQEMRPCEPIIFLIFRFQGLPEPMTSTSDEYSFLATLDRLRTQEALVLQPVLPQVSGEDLQMAGDYLEQEYDREKLEYPEGVPPYDAEAACWAATTVFFAAHLLLHRQDLPEALPKYLPPFVGDITPGGVLSADLCLRFLPHLLKKGYQLDPDDEIVPLLEGYLRRFGYSGLGYFDGVMEPADWQADPCVRQLCTDRIIALQLGAYLNAEPWQEAIHSSLGGYADHFWPQAAKRMT
ncbi:MAG TPA: hypothetical protein DCE41_22720 [Cytophagales bacterium]|nr:hypothetical protein [Cytophagales bacterium]